MTDGQTRAKHGAQGALDRAHAPARRAAGCRPWRSGRRAPAPAARGHKPRAHPESFVTSASTSPIRSIASARRVPPTRSKRCERIDAGTAELISSASGRSRDRRTARPRRPVRCAGSRGSRNAALASASPARTRRRCEGDDPRCRFESECLTGALPRHRREPVEAQAQPRHRRLPHGVDQARPALGIERAQIREQSDARLAAITHAPRNARKAGQQCGLPGVRQDVGDVVVVGRQGSTQAPARSEPEFSVGHGQFAHRAYLPCARTRVP